MSVPPVVPVRRRLPVILLALLPLVLGGALLVVALGPTSSATGPGSPDATLAAALAAAVARGQDAIVDSADQAPLARILADASSAPAALEKARVVLDELAASLGDPKGSVVMLDVAGRTRLARDRARGSNPVSLLAGARDLARVLALRGGALVASTGEAGRIVVFAVPVFDPGGTAVGALVAAVPVAALLGSASGLTASGLTAHGGAITLGSTAGAAWTAVATSGGQATPLSRTALLALAALSLLAVPFALWALRSPRARRLRPAIVLASPPVPTAPARSQAPVPQPASAASPAARTGRFGRGRKRPDAAPAPMPAVVPTASAASAGAAAVSPEELHDALSGLGNHRAFQEELDRLAVGWERNRVPFALLLLDVDDLRITNARAGHAAGDEQLRALGRQARAMLRFSDRAFRIGGDEIAVLLPHTDAAGAVHLGQRLLAKAAAAEDGEPAVAFSAGAAAFPDSAHDRDQLMAAAGAALAWCKSHGRASVQAYEPATHKVETDADRAEKQSAVAQVIRDRSLRAVFQPIVDMETGDVVGFEGLTRPAPGAPFTNPGLLFEAAERAGRTVELDAACFETIAKGARAIPVDRVVSINLSPRTMEAADFSVAGVLSVLAGHQLDPGRVILELTERESVLDLDRLRDNLAELQRAGVRIAADDVGAGNAGLRLLSQFRFDIVKVDLSLVQEGANNDASRAVLRSLRDLAQRWGAFVIAEGIETPTQLRVVRELGLAAGQGYLIGRPGTILDLPPVDLAGLEQGQLMMQNAPVPAGASFAQGRPA